MSAMETEDGKKRYNQKDIGLMLGGWGKTQVSRYLSLQSITKEAWDLLLPSFKSVGNNHAEPTGNDKLPVGNLSERLLRDITCLQPDHQYELISDLIKENITKSKFKNLAGAYTCLCFGL